MENTPNQPFNIYTVKPREVFMYDDERAALRRQAEKRIGDILDTASTSIVSSTDIPVTLKADRNLPPNQEFINVVNVLFDTADISVSHSVDPQREHHFEHATITLRRLDSPVRGRLTLLNDQLDDTDNHPLNPTFYYTANSPSNPREETFTPLTAAAANRILYGLLQQTNSPYKLLSPETQSITSNLTSLMDMSSRLRVERSAQEMYHFIPESELLGSITVDLHDVRLHAPEKPPVVIGSHVEVSKHQEVHHELRTTSYTDINCRLSSHMGDTTATIGMESGEIEPAEAVTFNSETMIDEYCDLERQYPGKFSMHILRGLEIMKSPQEGYFKEPPKQVRL